MEKYSSGLIEESFWFVEFKQFIKLLSEGRTWEEIKSMCLEDNLLGISKQYRITRIFAYLKNRIETLDKGMLDLFLESDLQTQKLINLIAIAKYNRLFFEFLYEVYREKVMLGALELMDSDINIFFKNKQEQDEKIAKWVDSTVKRLGSTYKNFLTDANLLTLENKQRKITPPILDIALEKYLETNGDIHMSKAIRGIN